MSQPIKVKIMNEKEPIKIKATSNFPTVYVGGETDHSKLKNLDYAHSGHTGFVKSEDGKGLSTNDFTNQDKEKLDSLENYILPVASVETLGGVKIGENLNIDENGVLSASGGDKIYYYKMTENYNKHDTTEATLAMFNEIAEKWRNGEKPLLLVQGYNTFEQYSWYAISAPLHGSWASNYLVFKFPSVYSLQQSGYDMWGDLEISCTANNTTDGIITAVDTSQKRQFYTTRYGVTSSRNTNQVLATDNTSSYTPTGDYNPSTKLYTDKTHYENMTGYDATKTQTLKNINGVLTWQTDGE